MLKKFIFNSFRIHSHSLWNPSKQLFQINRFYLSEIRQARPPVDISHKIHINFPSLPSLSQNPHALPTIAREIKSLRKTTDNIEFRSKLEILKSHADCNLYLKNLIKDLEQNKAYELYKYPVDLISLMVDLHKLDPKLLEERLINSLVENQLINIKQMDSLFISTCASFFYKVKMNNQTFWNNLKENITPATVKNMTASEFCNLMWGLCKAEQLSVDGKLYAALNETALQARYKELNFSDVAVLANLYVTKKDEQSLIRLSEIIIELNKVLRMHEILPKSLSNIFWALTSVHNSVQQEVWTILVRDYLLKVSQLFSKNQDVAQILVSLNKVKSKIKGLTPEERSRFEKACIFMVKRSLSQMQRASDNKRQPAIHEQDLTNILFAAIQLGFIPNEYIDPLTSKFMNNLDIIKPLGMGYCLHALTMKRRNILEKYSAQCLEFLKKHPEHVTNETIGYILLALHETFRANPETEGIINQIVQSIIDDRLRKYFDFEKPKQYFYTFHSLQAIGKLKTEPTLAQKLIEAFLLIRTNRLKKDLSVHEFSLFYHALMLHCNYHIQIPGHEEENHNFRKKLLQVTNQILKDVAESHRHEMTGFGHLVLSISKSNLNDPNIWQKIKDICQNLSFENLNLIESINLIKGLDLYGGSKNLVEELKERFYEQKIRTLSPEEITKLLSKPSIGTALTNWYSQEIKNLGISLKETQQGEKFNNENAEKSNI